MSHDPENQLKTPDGTPIIQGPDGIQELDNPMPRWMAMVFIFTILWGVGYIVAMPGMGINLLGYSQYKSYDAEVAEAKAKFGDASAVDPAALVAKAVGDHEAIERGETIFKSNCAACHGEHGQGAIGPSLSDATWLYGGEPAKIVHTIAEGTAKGMPPFKSSLSPAQLADITAFVNALGTGKEH